MSRRNRIRYRRQPRYYSPPAQTPRQRGWGITLLRAVELFAALAAICAVSAWYFVERPAIQEQRVARAWQILLAESPANSGKSEALQIMAKNGVSVNGIDLSASKHGGSVVIAFTDLSNIDFTWAKAEKISFRDTNMNAANFNAADLTEARFSFASLNGASFVSTRMPGADFFNCNMTRTRFRIANMTDVSFLQSDLTGAIFDSVRLKNVTFNDANISDANFDGVTETTLDQFLGAWAWTDRPPRNLPKGAKMPQLADPDLRKRWQKIRDQEPSFSGYPSVYNIEEYENIMWPNSRRN